MASCKLQYLWRAIDQDGEVLDILAQPLCNKQAAKRFFRKLLKGLQYIPRAIIADKLLDKRSSNSRGEFPSANA